MTEIVRPDAQTIDALQSALDKGWPADPAPLLAALKTYRAAIEGLRSATAQPLPRLSAEQLATLRLAVGLTLVDGMGALARGEADLATRDTVAVLTLGVGLVHGKDVGEQVVGAGCISRAASLGARLPPSDALRAAAAASLPTLSAIREAERTRFLDAAHKAAEADRSLAPHVEKAARSLADEYYGPDASDEKVRARFDVLATRIGNVYGVLDPARVTSMLPIPAPPPDRLGADVAAVVLCIHWPDARLLLVRYGEALGQLEKMRR
jgi:hypothetical protein